MTQPSSLDELIEALRCLPSVGPKSAQRMAYHLLQRDPRGAERLSAAIDHALKTLRRCERCNTFTEDEVCDRCRSPRRDAALLCIVEMPVDLNTMEQTRAFNGLYYVLMGRLSPLDGVGPKELGFDRLLARATDGVVRGGPGDQLRQRGEATALHFRDAACAASRSADWRGLPVGELSDTAAVAQTLLERRDY
jgi:recombination protein RecR